MNPRRTVLRGGETAGFNLFYFRARLILETAAVTYMRYHSTLIQLKYVACLLHSELNELGNHLEYLAMHTCNVEGKAVGHVTRHQTQTTQTSTISGLRATLVSYDT